MNNIKLVYLEIDRTHPQLVLLSGKTSTGKTTLSNDLRENYDCAVIELDTIVEKLESKQGTNKYIEAYQKRDDIEFTSRFVQAVQQQVHTVLKTHSFVIIEGALSNSDTLREIIREWSSSFLFVFLDIKNIETYIGRLTDRFKNSSGTNRNSLPSLFWEKFNPEDLKRYYDNRKITPAIEGAIKAYAIDSKRVSQTRLANFSDQFDHILQVEV